MADETTSVTEWVGAGDVNHVTQIAEAQGAQAKEAEISGFGPLLLIPIIIFGSIAAVAAAQREIEVWRGGQVFDLTKTPVDIRRDHHLQYGLIAVIAKDGTIKVTASDVKDSLSEIITALQRILTDLGKDTIDQAAAAVKAAVGDKGTVTTTPTPDLKPAT